MTQLTQPSLPSSSLRAAARADFTDAQRPAAAARGRSLSAFLAPRRLSCGIVIVNAARELLLCHVTGQDHWDLPKGGIEPGETPIQAALRETQEETGLRLAGEHLVELGVFGYRPKKQLHLFATLMRRFDVSVLQCDSHFSERSSGRRLPEMDGYGWFSFDAIAMQCTPRMTAVLTERIDLDAIVTAWPAPAAALSA